MRWILALLAAAATSLIIMPFKFQRFGKISRVQSIVAKVIPTLMCAAFAGTAVTHGGGRYALLVFIGLCICAVADAVLSVHFIAGGSLFFVGHLFYIAAFCVQQPPTWWSAPVFGVTLALLWLYLRMLKPLRQKPHLYLCAHLYCTALAVVLGLGLPMPLLGFSQRTLLAALGAFLFALSDMGVCHGLACSISNRRSACYLGIYYLAQLLLGLSAF